MAWVQTFKSDGEFTVKAEGMRFKCFGKATDEASRDYDGSKGY